MRRVVARLGDGLLWVTAAAGLTAIAASAVLWFSGARPVVVTSGSMEPTYPVRSVVIVRPVDPHRVHGGDVLAMNLPNGRRVLHRVVDVERTGDGITVTTKGDANRAPDAEPVTVAGTAWRAGASVPLVGAIVSAMRSPLAGFGLALLCLGPIAMSRQRHQTSGATAHGPAVA